jgi:hypothetical protein
MGMNVLVPGPLGASYIMTVFPPVVTDPVKFEMAKGVDGSPVVRLGVFY